MLGSRLKAARARAKHTQASLSEVMGTDARQIWRWENDENDPNGETVRRLAMALEVSSDYLLGLTDDPLPMTDNADLSKGERKIIQALRDGDLATAIKEIAAKV